MIRNRADVITVVVGVMLAGSLLGVVFLVDLKDDKTTPPPSRKLCVHLTYGYETEEVCGEETFYFDRPDDHALIYVNPQQGIVDIEIVPFPVEVP